jgi:2-(1,2-epoxy-1,2-dihydrophenyl)acetyl-CoA isomerase
VRIASPITLNRPDAYNTLNLALGRDLFDAVLAVDEDPEVRCVIITGAGKAFCGGGDVKDFEENLPRFGAFAKELTTYVHGAVSRLVRTQKPVVMAVNGVAAGAGFSLAISGDLVLAAESARFTMAYSKIGATPDGSSTYFLTRLLGLRRALELYLTNRVLSAKEALEWGLVTRVVPDAELATATTSLAKELTQGPTKAFGAAKILFQHSTQESLETQLELESQPIAASAAPRISELALPHFAPRVRRYSRETDNFKSPRWRALRRNARMSLPFCAIGKPM